MKLTFENAASKIGRPVNVATEESIDLDSKQLSEIGDLSKFRELKSLNLSNNRIAFLRQVDGVFAAPKLETLVLVGNPVCSSPGYREYIISKCPALLSLDQIEVTLDERKGKSPPAKPTPTTPGPSDASTWDGITAPTCGTEKKVAAPVSKAAIEEKVPEPQSLQIAISAACAKPLSVPSEVPPVETKQAQKSAQPTASTVFKDSRSKLQIRTEQAPQPTKAPKPAGAKKPIEKFDEDILFGSTTSGTDILSSLDDINIQIEDLDFDKLDVLLQKPASKSTTVGPIDFLSDLSSPSGAPIDEDEDDIFTFVKPSAATNIHVGTGFNIDEYISKQASNSSQSLFD